jgi:glutamine amidotransferase PdxT
MTVLKKVAVVDYGMGNLRSVSQALTHVALGTGWEVIVTAKVQDVLDADRVVLPGQGAMRDCMHELDASGLRQAVLHAAANKPLFGVCVGMQMLLEHSQEVLTFLRLFQARGEEYLLFLEHLAKLMIAVARAAEAGISTLLKEKAAPAADQVASIKHTTVTNAASSTVDASATYRD